MKRLQVYLSTEQEKHVKKLTGKENFTGADVVQLIMKMWDMAHQEMVVIFKQMADFLKTKKPE